MPDTVLLMRSGRHLADGVRALRRTLPGCDISVLSQPGTEQLLADAGVPPERTLIYPGSRFSAWQLLRTGIARRVRSAGFRRVAVLRNYPDGAGQANVLWAAWLLAPEGLIAITPDGAVIPTSGIQLAAAWWSRTMRLMRDPIQAGVDRLANWWRHLRQLAEGAELEPRIWHSHFLTAWLAKRRLPSLARLLEGRVLDIGAGTGYAARFLPPTVTTYLPTDLPGGRDAADATISTQGLRPVLYCSGAALPFRSDSIDGVMALSLLEHVPDPGAVLREAFRALRPGGRALLVTPFCFPFHGEPHDYRRWTAAGLAQEAKMCGFEPERTERLGASGTALALNLQLLVKYQWGLSPFWGLRALAAAWPAWLVAQAVLNLVAITLDGFESSPSLPVGVAVLARKPFTQIGERQ